MKEPERPCPVWPSMAYSSKAGRLYEKQYFPARPVGGASGVDLDSFFIPLADSIYLRDCVSHLYIWLVYFRYHAILSSTKG